MYMWSDEKYKVGKCVVMVYYCECVFVQDFPMGGGPDGGPMGPMGPNSMGPVLNGDGMDGMKNSPANGGPGTPREDSGSGMGDYNLSGFGGPGENVSINVNGAMHL